MNSLQETMQANVMRSLWSCSSSSSSILLNTRQHQPSYSISSTRISKNSRIAPNKSLTKAATKNGHVTVEQELKPLWDDGYGSQTVRDYLEAAKVMAKLSDGGPPRWFCPVECGPPIPNSPLLLYLPGIDGVGMGMVLHHKAIGKVFRVQCMHVPVDDRTPYEKLVELVGKAVEEEHASSPKMPIYLIGDSFGGCLALSVAAAYPEIDLVLILVNPATSFDRSQLQPLLPFLDLLPANFLPYILAATSGHPLKMATVKQYVAHSPTNSPAKQIETLLHDLSHLSSAGLSTLSEILPKQTLQWKLKLLKTGAAAANLRLHTLQNEVLILASGNDLMLPSKDEAERLKTLLKNSRVRFFRDNGHLLLMEDGINLLTVIKGNHIYRRSKLRDAVTDFLPPSKSEFRFVFEKQVGIMRTAVSPVMLSTLDNGEIVRGLRGVPQEGPVLLVGYHMLMGSEITCLAEHFLMEKNLMVHGLAHPMIFQMNMKKNFEGTTGFDYFKVFGALPVSAKNLCRLMSAKSHALLYPGGVREALHRKGEAYKIFWPEDPEFVRIAVKYGAKIVPFGVVGEDDLFELFLDYDDLMKVPIVRESVRRENEMMPRVRAGRSEVKGKVAEQFFYVPGVYPKVPGRFYFLFGKAMETKGREELLKDNEGVKEFYEELKRKVEGSMEYLLKKREEDPYRHVVDRLMYRAFFASIHDTPTFPL